MRIPEELIQTIRDRASIVDVVGAHVALKRAGRTWKGLCPFHTEKTPSFTVNEERGTYKCFGCGKGGNAFTFLMEMEGRTFREAAEILAAKAGILLPREEESPQERQRRAEADAVRDVLELAARYYRYQFTQGRAGEAARAYALKRGISGETEERFGIGCAPPGWDNLARYLAGKKIAMEVAERAGLVAKRQSGGYYDRFRDRLMFPITDAMGRTVSFGGRVIGQGEPKYLNGPETEIFHKGRVLYGLFQGAEALRQSGKALLVEGYMDVVILHQRGYGGCLATLGTALTREHVEAIRRRVDEAVLIYDGDEAGRKAMDRSLEIFLSEGFPCRAVLLPEGEDPDTFVAGGNDLHALVDGAPSLFEVCLGRIRARHDVARVEGRIAAVAEVAPSLRAVRDDLSRDLYLRRAAEALGVEEGLLRKKVAAVRDAPVRSSDAGTPAEPPPPLDAKELMLARLLVHDPGVRSHFRDHGLEEWMEEGPVRRLAVFVGSREEPLESFPIEEAPEELQDLLTALVMEDGPADYGAVVGAMERRMLERRAAELVRRIRAAEAEGDRDESARLIHEKKEIDRKISNVRS